MMYECKFVLQLNNNGKIIRKPAGILDNMFYGGL